MSITFGDDPPDSVVTGEEYAEFKSFKERWSSKPPLKLEDCLKTGKVVRMTQQEYEEFKSFKEPTSPPLPPAVPPSSPVTDPELHKDEHIDILVRDTGLSHQFCPLFDITVAGMHPLLCPLEEERDHIRSRPLTIVSEASKEFFESSPNLDPQKPIVVCVHCFELLGIDADVTAHQRAYLESILVPTDSDDRVICCNNPMCQTAFVPPQLSVTVPRSLFMSNLLDVLGIHYIHYARVSALAQVKPEVYKESSPILELEGMFGSTNMNCTFFHVIRSLELPIILTTRIGKVVESMLTTPEEQPTQEKLKEVFELALQLPKVLNTQLRMIAQAASLRAVARASEQPTGGAVLFNEFITAKRLLDGLMHDRENTEGSPINPWEKLPSTAQSAELCQKIHKLIQAVQEKAKKDIEAKTAVDAFIDEWN